MLIDFFTYTNATDGGQLSADDLIERAVALGLDGLCVTDREYSLHAEEIVAAGERRDLFVGVGVELSTEEGRLVCLPPAIDDFLLAEEWRDLVAFGLPTAQEVIDHVNALGGVVIARSVYEKGNSVGDAIFRLDGLAAIDALSPRRERIFNELSLEAALALGVPGLAGSSARRSVQEMGSVATLMFNAVDSQAELVESLKSGDCWPVILGEPGPWAPTGGGGGGGDRERRGDRGGDRERRGGGDRERRGGGGGRGGDRRGGGGGDRRGGGDRGRRGG